MSLIKFNKKNNLFPWNYDSMTNLFNTDDFFSTDFFENTSFLPAMNVKENEENFEIEFAIPGYSKEDFQVTIENDVLNVSSEKKKESEDTKDNYTRKEFSFSSFKRSLKLPDSVNLKQEVKATYKDGILKLTLQKLEETKKAEKKVIEVSG